jgi:hypothetical protein
MVGERQVSQWRACENTGLRTVRMAGKRAERRNQDGTYIMYGMHFFNYNRLGRKNEGFGLFGLVDDKNQISIQMGRENRSREICIM